LVFHNGRGSCFLVSDAIEHETIHTVRWGCNVLGCIKLGGGESMKISIDLHGCWSTYKKAIYKQGQGVRSGVIWSNNASTIKKL
jgi:hypothetical protein